MLLGIPAREVLGLKPRGDNSARLLLPPPAVSIVANKSCPGADALPYPNRRFLREGSSRLVSSNRVFRSELHLHPHPHPHSNPNYADAVIPRPHMRSLPLRVLILLCIVCLPCVLRAQIAPRARWIALVPGATAGAPVQMQVTKAGKQTTTLEIHLTGFWLNTRTYAGRTFSEITLPEARLGGLGFPQRAGERGWYDFPAETRQSILPSDRYTLALEHSVPKPMFPQKALGQTPRTERDMLALGVNPAGARPGIPALRGYVAVSRRNKDADLALTIRSEQMAAVRLESPLLPAGFQGSDQSVAREGYTPPELVDEEFYSTFKGDYRGTEQTLSRIEGAGVFSQAQFRMPLISVQDPHAIRVVTNLVVELKHLAGVEDFECALAWDTWYFKNGFVNGIALLESVTAKGLKIEASRSAHYLILTPHAYRSELDEFAEWKQSKGLNVDFSYVGNSVDRKSVV